MSRKPVSSPERSAVARAGEALDAYDSFPVVGIGASAGGLEAFTQLLTSLPENTGMAFVLVQHLDPDHPSHLTDLLARSTTMPVVEVKNGMTVKPDHVYVIPPNVNMGLSKGKLKLTPREEGRAPHLPVDFLFRSLAREQQRYAIGVILSGTGSDGALGLAEIKGAGGLTFAQDEKSAKFSGMPLNAASGEVDFVLSPGKIARELARIGRDPYLVAPRKTDSEAKQAQIAKDFRRVLAILRSQTNADFSQYRDSTIKRRIQRRMVVHNRRTLAEYIKMLEKNRDEVRALFEDVLINVTSFFRDPELFETLKAKVFPEILKTKPQVIRVWVTACSTGQEAYSMAIALLEFLEHKPNPPGIQIFATDINENVSVEKARRGYFPAGIESEVSPERLRRYFTKEDNRYRISKTIRDVCVFAKQNIVSDPPFSRTDLISCRNLLIYFTPNLQQQVISTFHYALKPSGFLVLGSSETLGAGSDLYEPVDRKSKIFSKKGTASRPLGHFMAHDLKAGMLAAARGNGPYTPGPGDFQKEADRILLGRFAPAAVLVNSNLEVLQFRGRTSPYLEMSAGPASFNLLKMARDNLPLDLGKAIQEARRKNASVRRNAPLHDGETIRKINLEVVPVKVAGSSENCFLILFEEETAKVRAALEQTAGRKKEIGGLKKPAAEKDKKLQQLRRELAAAHQYLQGVVEQHEVSNEELKCANEEVLSSNEELQSTNEQLGTAKEELQSSNEELVTLNEELQTRNVELSQLNSELREAHAKLLDYVNAMTDTVRAPLLVLGADLIIRNANDAFYKTFQAAVEETENHLIFELGNGQWDIPQLRQLLSEIVSGKTVLKDFEVVHSFPQIGRRVMVLNARRLEQKPGVPHIILLSIEDVTEFKQIEEVNQWLAAIVESSGDAIMGEDLEGNIVSCNRGVSRLFGYAPAELIGQKVSIMVPPDREGEDRRILDRIKHGEHVEHYETRRRRKDGTLADVSLTVSPVKDAHGKIIGASKIARDVTERKRTEAALVESEDRFRTAADNAPVLIWISGTDKLCTWFNKPWLDFVGRPMEEVIGTGWAENVHPADYELYLEIYRTSFEARQEFKMEYRLRRHDGEYRWFLDHGIPRYFGTEFVGYIGSCVDVTDRRIAEEDLKASLSREKEARQTAEAASRAKDSFLAALSHELRTPLNPVLLIASDAAKNPDLPRDLQRDFETILKNVELEARLIDDLLDLTRISVGKLRLNMEVQSAHAILRDAIAAVKPEVIQKRLKLILNLKAERDEVRCDGVRLQQVFWNVFKNAVKFTPDHGKIVVETSVSAGDEKLVVRITDTGIGITREELDHLFLNFSQGIESHRFGGLGLGLAISRKLIEFHSGEIRATSEGRDRGATFSIELPLAQTKNGNASPSENGTDEVPPEQHPKKTGARILLVEDHEPTRTALTHLLTRRHYQVAAAGSVAEAREIAEKEKVDFVISDIGLPDGSGHDLMSELRERHGLKGIALTGYGMEHDIASSKTAGFVAHLTKPVHVQMLENALALPALKDS